MNYISQDPQLTVFLVAVANGRHKQKISALTKGEAEVGGGPASTLSALGGSLAGLQVTGRDTTFFSFVPSVQGSSSFKQIPISSSSAVIF